VRVYGAGAIVSAVTGCLLLIKDFIAIHIATDADVKRPSDQSGLYIHHRFKRIVGRSPDESIRCVGIVEVAVESQVLWKTTGDC
jgi:hypothetical protein